MTDTVVVDCLAIASGNASRVDKTLALQADLELVIDKNTSFSKVANAVLVILQQKVAPVVSRCTTRRLLQNNSTIITNVVFSAPVVDLAGE